MTRATGLILPALTVLCGAAATAVIEPGGPPLRITPHTVEIGLLYRVPPIRIEGRVPPDAQVVVVVQGEHNEETFNKKVRAGPIWISSGKVHISGAPSLFLSFSSAPLESLAEHRSLVERALTPAAIRERIHVDAEGAPVDEEAMRSHYLALKARNGFYQVHNGGVELGRPGGAGAPFSVTFEWPRKASPGTYTVTAFELKDGRVTPVAEEQLRVMETGLAAWISQFAAERAAQYGILAVLLAVIAGFGIDFLAARIFRSGRKIAH